MTRAAPRRLATPPTARRAARRSVHLRLLLLTLLLLPHPARAQQAHAARGTHAEAMATNALLGAATATLTALVRGQPLRPALLGGAAGGMLVFMGKRLAVSPADGAGLAGRQLAAVGGSIIRNAAAGQPAFDELALPLGPVRVYVRPGAGARVKLDGATTLAALHYTLVRAGSLDAGASLSSGALVFRAQPGTMTQIGNLHAVGEAAAGAVLMGDVHPIRSAAAAHERIHVLQHDQILLSIGEPTERALAGLHPAPRAAQEWVDFGLLASLQLLGNHLLDYGDRPWEWEADLLSAPRTPAARFVGR